MAAQILWFNKSTIDLELSGPAITITDAVATNTGQSLVNFMRDRRNFSIWGTTGSTDAANTQIDISLGDLKQITDILLIGHNLKAYTIQYKSGISSYQNFSTSVAETINAQSTNLHSFNAVQATDIRIIITGAQTVDADKFIKQLIISDRIGQFSAWPVIKNPTIRTNKRKSLMLDGRTRIVEGLEAFGCTIDVRHWSSQNDADILEEIYFKREGVLMYINADDPTQFVNDIKGYRREDIFLVRPEDDFKAELVGGIYNNGLRRSIKLVEVIS